jgi:hypothetical protein
MKTLTKVLEFLMEKAYNNLLIERYEIADIVRESTLRQKTFVVLMISKIKEREDNIMATLCAVKQKNDDIIFSQSRDDLIEKIKLVINSYNENDKLLELLEKNFEKSRFIKKSKIKVYYQGHISQNEFDLLDKAFNFLRQNSPNMLNASLDLSLKESKKIELRYKDSIHDTAESISKYIIESYRYECTLFNLNEDIYKLDKILTENIYPLITYGRPLYFFRHDQWILLFPFINDRKSGKIEHVFKITSSKSISKYLIINLTKSFNYYFNSFIPRLIINHIADLQNRIIKIYYDKSKYIEGINLKKELKLFSEVSFGKIINNSGAHSATLRIFDPFSKKLLLISEVLSSKNNFNKDTDRDIPLKDHKSINVLTFKNCKKNSFSFSKDIKDYKKELGIFDRPTSKSELCFPLYFKQIKIGTINFESPSEDGFGTILKRTKTIKKNIDEYSNDTTFNYYYSIKNLIEEYSEVLFDSSDKLWLSKRIHIYQNIHELKSLLQVDDIGDQYKETIRNAINLSQEATPEDSGIELFKSIEQFYNEFISDIKNQSLEVARLLESKIFFQNSKNSIIHISGETYSFLNILFKNVFSNFNRLDKFSDGEFINVSLSKNVLTLKIFFAFNNYSEKNIDKYFVRPFSDIIRESKKVHYGLFLIGMITRQLKGFFHFHPPDGASAISRVIIYIPFN